MKSFKPNAWFLPQTVIIIGTYDADGTLNAMNAAWSGTWDHDEIFISMGNHQTTVNLNENPDFTIAFATKETMVAADYVGVVSGKKAKEKKLNESATGYYIIAKVLNIQCREDILAEDGKPDVEKIHLITFDPIHMGYIELGARVGNAFKDGTQLK